MSVGKPIHGNSALRTPGQRLRALVLQLGLALLLIASNIGQRVAFKNVGYVLGPYPYFVLLSISATIPVVLGVVCLFVYAVSGFSPGTCSLRNVVIFFTLGFAAALNGVGMVFANPHVAGYLQALLQQSIVPMTLVASMSILATQFSPTQYAGVLMIVAGVLLQLWPSMSNGDASASSGFSWQCIFMLAQLPNALAAILQEHTFQSAPVDVRLMLFWSSTAQFVTFVMLAPLDCVPNVGDSSPVDEFFSNLSEAWHLVRGGTASVALISCIVTLLLSQFLQMLMVKHSSAAFAVLCMAFVVPGSAVVFTLPLVMGSHAEQLSDTAPLALALVFFGIMGFKLGELETSPDTSASKSDEAAIGQNDAISQATHLQVPLMGNKYDVEPLPSARNTMERSASMLSQLGSALLGNSSMSDCLVTIHEVDA